MELNIPIGYSSDEYDDGPETPDSVGKRGLWHEVFAVGNLLTFADGKQELIGHINKNRGQCDCCANYSSDRVRVLVRYERIWTPEAA